jgi:hypothetical protein
MTTTEPFANIGRHIRHTNSDGFRAHLPAPDCWATVLAIVTTESGRDSYVVRFDDGVTDLWLVNDPSDPYAFEDIPAPARLDVTATLASLLDDHLPENSVVVDAGCICGYNGPATWAQHVAVLAAEALGLDLDLAELDLDLAEPAPRFVVVSINSERFEYRSRHLVVDVAQRDVVAESDERLDADRVAAALELQPEPPNWVAPDLEPF